MLRPLASLVDQRVVGRGVQFYGDLLLCKAKYLPSEGRPTGTLYEEHIDPGRAGPVTVWRHYNGIVPGENLAGKVVCSLQTPFGLDGGCFSEEGIKTRNGP